MPGLIEGYPPVALDDVVRLRLLSAADSYGRPPTALALPPEYLAGAGGHSFTEVAAVVVRVIPRASTVVLALPPMLTGTLIPQAAMSNKSMSICHGVAELTAHVRFAYDEALFRAQRMALQAAAANPVAGWCRFTPSNPR